MRKSHKLLLAGLGLATASGLTLVSAGVGAEASIDTVSNQTAVYMMCARDGRMGSPGEPNACMQMHQPDDQTVCTGSGDAQICASSLFSLCKAAGDAAGKPMNDQAGKGTFPDKQACMARCDAHEAADGRFGGTCEGDITPQ